jgi:uncharacterized repeat protein (TIGR01451 family)
MILSNRATALTVLGTSLMLAATASHAAPEVTVVQPVTGSTTMVEQYSNGQVATITATPNGITMRNGMPYAITQVTNVPRYSYSVQGAAVVNAPVGTTMSVANAPATIVSAPMPVQQVAVQQVAVAAPAVTNQLTTTVALDTLQLTPTFSTPNVVNAQTKVMKILKDSTGKEFAVPANHVAPGDVIEYQTTYINTTPQPVSNINATVSLPNGVKLVSLNSPITTLATTGGNSYQTISQVGNTTVIQENYTGLKWDLVDLAPNAKQTVTMRAKVQ